MTAREELIEDSKYIKSPQNRKLVILACVMVMLSMVVAGVASYLAYSAANLKAQQGRSLAQQVREACINPRLNTGDMSAICKKANEVASEPAPATIPLQGPEGKPGPPPSDAQVSLALTRYCSSFTCRGANGKNATQAQVRSAVAMYCNLRGECIGPEGEDGTDGQDGQQGKQGPPPSEDQVAKAVADYCSTRNDCRGQAGQDGTPGRGIQAVACTQGNATFTITYTDGSTQTVECDEEGDSDDTQP